MADEFEANIQRVMGNLGNGFLQALVCLDKCLLNNGALKPGQFSDALKGTFNDPGADWERFDYEVLRLLAKFIDEAEAR